MCWMKIPANIELCTRENILQEWEQNKDRNIETEFITNWPSEIKILNLIYTYIYKEKLATLDRNYEFPKVYEQQIKW